MKTLDGLPAHWTDEQRDEFLHLYFQGMDVEAAWAMYTPLDE